MGVVKTLRASVQGYPMSMRRVAGWLAIFWIVMISISMWQGWSNSVLYVSALSPWALVAGHWSAWQAARVEVRQQARHRHIPNAIVERASVELQRTTTATEGAPA